MYNSKYAMTVVHKISAAREPIVEKRQQYFNVCEYMYMSFFLDRIRHHRRFARAI